MWGLLIGWVLLAVAFFLTTQVVPGVRVTGGPPAYLVAAVVFGLVNAVLGPILRLATLPLRILSLGLFALVLNGVLLLAAAAVAPGELSVSGLWSAVIGAFVLSMASALLNAIVGPITRAATN
jgi:putative membrane protein